MDSIRTNSKPDVNETKRGLNDVENFSGSIREDYSLERDRCLVCGRKAIGNTNVCYRCSS